MTKNLRERLTALAANPVVVWLLVITGVLITRLPFRARYLYEWDSVEYALAIDKLDIAWHQPHPPGYIFFVYLARLSAQVFQDRNTALIAVSIFLSILTVGILYFLAAADLFIPHCADRNRSAAI